MIWPQDTLVNPLSNRRNVDEVSALTTDREFFAYIHTFQMNVNQGGIFTKVHTVDQTFNYWFSNFCVMSFANSTTAPVQGSFSSGRFALTDNEQGYKPLDISVASIRNANMHNSRRPFLPEPYVIRAGQSFTTEFEIPAGTSNVIYQIQLLVQGWKDYSY